MEEIHYFETPAEFREWLENHHSKAKEVWVGYWKKGSGMPSLTWPESVDQALCFGWIDGIRKTVDGQRYKIRFTPRKPGSIWSKINVEKVRTLREVGLMTQAGEKAFAQLNPEKSGIYSFERDFVGFSPEIEAQFQSVPLAWARFQKLAPSQRKVAMHWVMSAKREETRQSRLARLMAGKFAEIGIKVRRDL